MAPGMPAADLPAEIWAVIGLIAGLAATMSLVVLANLHAYVLQVRKLRHDVRRLRAQYREAFRDVDLVEEPPVPAGSAPTPARKAA
jgi:hypothetical protein